jgi:hypothetical protein
MTPKALQPTRPSRSGSKRNNTIDVRSAKC